MKLKIIIAVVAVVLVVAALAGIKTLQIRKLMSQPFPPQIETISSAVAREEKWQGTLSAIGSVTAVQGVNLTTELSGTVKEITFESGAIVAKDDLLLRLDTSSEEAQLRATEAQVDWTRISAERSRKLRTDSTVSQAELDSAEAGLKQAVANADTIRSAIAKKTIHAPFAGRLGIRLVSLGEYIEAGKTAIVSLQSVSPVHADFSLPQQELAQLKVGMKVRLSTDAFPDRHFDGSLTAINPDLDSATRSVRLQATLDNPDQSLHPGMYARVEVLLASEQNKLVIPATSVLSAPYGDSVYVIEPKAATTNSPAGLVVRQQFIRTGRGRGDFVSVESGLKPGEKVVSAGVFKLRNGMGVVESNEMTPKADKKPNPSDS